METFFSILYCPINPITDEKLSIGLVLANDDHFLFSYSQKKMAVLKDLLPGEVYDLLQLSLKSIQNLKENRFNKPFLKH